MHLIYLLYLMEYILRARDPCFKDPGLKRTVCSRTYGNIQIHIVMFVLCVWAEIDTQYITILQFVFRTSGLVFLMSGLVFGTSGLVFWVSGLVFRCVDFFLIPYIILVGPRESGPPVCVIRSVSSRQYDVDSVISPNG